MRHLSIPLPIIPSSYLRTAGDALCWPQSDHSRVDKCIIARVGKIVENTDALEWLLIPAKLIVAIKGQRDRRPLASLHRALGQENNEEEGKKEQGFKKKHERASVKRERVTPSSSRRMSLSAMASPSSV